MCLSIAYRTSEAPDNIIMENVKSIECHDGAVFLTNIMEATLEVKGELILADLIGGRVVIKEVA